MMNKLRMSLAIRTIQTFVPKKLSLNHFVVTASRALAIQRFQSNDPILRSRSWAEMSSLQQSQWKILGWNYMNWTTGIPSPKSEDLDWEDLSEIERAAATRLGYDKDKWDNEEEEGKDSSMYYLMGLFFILASVAVWNTLEDRKQESRLKLKPGQRDDLKKFIIGICRHDELHLNEMYGFICF